MVYHYVSVREHHTSLDMASAEGASAATASGGGAEAAEVVPLESIWECPMMNQTVDPTTNKKKMGCDHCGMSVACNATKLVFHAAKRTGGDIKICPAVHSDSFKKQYNDLFDKMQAEKVARQMSKSQAMNDIVEQQASTIAAYQQSMPSSRGAKRSSEVIDVDVDGDGGGKPAAIRSSFKKPKNHVQSTLVTTNPGNQGVATMDVHLADFILSNGLPPSLVECPKLKLVIEGAKHIPNSYKPPSRQLVAGPLLDTNHATVSNKIDEQLLKNLEVYGLTIFGDGATILRTPLINILAAGVHNEAGLLDIANCTGHMAKGFKKDAEYIAKLFIPHMQRLDPEKNRYVIV